MSFHPNNYINGLNLEFDPISLSNPEDNNDIASIDDGFFYNDSDLTKQEELQQHLELFSEAAINDFYSLIVMNDNVIIPNKPQLQHQEIKQEEIVENDLISPKIKQEEQSQQSLQDYHNSLNNQQQLPSFVNSNSVNNKSTASTPYSIATTSSTSPIYQINSNTTNSTSQHQTPQNSLSSSATQAANDDKKKRNTAASARFRIKKKLKEQEMEKKSKELEEKVEILEKKLKTIEMENKCLKNIIFQQNEKKNNDLLETIKQKSIINKNSSSFEFTV
ncbi:uncharacterized protein KGF55_004977 [Candida pseudojiufengensis]|uniref:uncharacterized protein n=1 Tax=Candida pseudojiufengensis TaxID=497109 RepID=UPI0022245180|nr:uncharacterized protein KGF55_004977 [Candida pseudojiufengensis]KAI5959745.1 hypothetical protein KGF55_004977 [Candida pseudojiufengensis]